MMKALLFGVGIGLIVTVFPGLLTLSLLSIWATIRIVSWDLDKIDSQRINVLLMFIGEVGTLLFWGRIKIF